MDFEGDRFRAASNYGIDIFQPVHNPSDKLHPESLEGQIMDSISNDYNESFIPAIYTSILRKKNIFFHVQCA